MRRRRHRHRGQSAEARNTDVCRLRNKHRNKRAKWIGGECALKERQKDGNATEYRVPLRDDFLYAYTSNAYNENRRKRKRRPE